MVEKEDVDDKIDKAIKAFEKLAEEVRKGKRKTASLFAKPK